MKCTIGNIATTYSETYYCMSIHGTTPISDFNKKKYQQTRFLFYVFYLLYSMCEMRNTVKYFWIQAKCSTFCL